jgi:hypothetical protein
MRGTRGVRSLLVGCCLLLPAAAFAQATLAGVVRDNTGAVLPGVTVEATSPVLIEKARTAVTDGSGQYRITELSPGAYVLTFTLTGFTAVRRADVDVRGSGVIAINAEMRVGALEETITVTGESPLVDTQTTRRETVLTADTVSVLPATRSYGALLSAVPGLMTNNTSLGAMTNPFMTMFTANGGRANEGRMTIDGLPVAASFNGGGVSTFIYDVANADELQVLVSGGLGEAEAGGPIMNLVPRSGGNTYRGSAFYSSAGRWSQSNNIDDDLRRVGITEPPTLVRNYDVSATIGGPIKRDRLWFFGNVRDFGNATIVEGAFANRHAGDASRWDYARDENVLTRSADRRDILSFRLTAQVSERNRVSFSHEYQHRCSGSTIGGDGEGCRTREAGWIGLGSLTASPETWPGYHDFPYHVTQATWSSPVSNRVLIDAGFSRFQYLWAGFGQAPPDGLTDVIPVTERAAIDGHRANFTYRGMFDPLGFGWADNDASPTNWRASLSYVSGAHNVKVGYQGSYQKSLQGREANTTLMRYTFNNRVPESVSYYIAPRWEQNDRTASTAFYVQDQWTMGRLTLQGAVRYDRAWSWAPAEHNGTALTSPFLSSPIEFERTASVDAYNDITTRFGGAWDVFGTGRTAVKVNVGKYLQNATNDENYWANNPSRRIVTAVGTGGVPARGWQDGNGNFVVDCDLANPAEQNNLAGGGDRCAALGGNQLNFGNLNPNLTVVNPDILRGWGVRPSDWQFGASVQQQLLPRLSADVSYNRRSFGNFFVVDNQLVGPADYEPWTYTAPQHAGLPDGGGYPITMYSITRAAALRGARNYQTFETDFGPARTQYWHGVNLTINARPRNGLTFQGGTSTGRGVRDTCETEVNIDSPDPRGCHVTEPWMTALRGLAAYTVPKVDVLVSAQFRSLNPANTVGMGSASATNGSSLNANTQVPNRVVAQLLGRTPGTTLITQTTTVNLLADGELYPDGRVHQMDMRFAKIVRFGDRRLDIGIDLYNVFNTNHVTGFDQSFDYGVADGGGWLQPTSIVSPRFARFNLTLTF